MERKMFRVKDLDDAGSAQAVIATLNVVDHDGDVTMPGAFGEQQAKVQPAHDWMHVALGKAKIREEGDEVIADVKFNMDIEAARDWHSALKFDLKNGTPLQEWSYGFAISSPEGSSRGEHEGQEVRFLKSVDVHEVSPVLLGAGRGTRTLSAKSFDQCVFREQLSKTIDVVSCTLKRAERIAELRADESRELGKDRKQQIVDLREGLDELRALCERADELLKGTEKTQKKEDKAAIEESLFADFSRIMSRRHLTHGR